MYPSIPKNSESVKHDEKRGDATPLYSAYGPSFLSSLEKQSKVESYILDD
jgi:hypothetical protein